MLLLITQVLLTSSTITFAQESEACKDVTKANVSSINIGFDYKGKRSVVKKLNNTGRDAAFYAANFAQMSDIGTQGFFIDRDADKTKHEFIQKIKDQIGTAQYVNFNMSGHGAVLPDGQWGLLLPNVPEEYVRRCVHQIDLGKVVELSATPPEGFKPLCDKFRDYFLTGEDLQQALPGRKFFNVIDSCNAGAAKFGPNSMTIASSLAGEVSGDGLGNNGTLTEKISQIMDNCSTDKNKDSFINANEIIKPFSSINKQYKDTPTEKMSYANRRGKISRLSDQHPGLVFTNANQPWLSCLKLNRISYKCSTVTEDKKNIVDK